MVGRKTEKMTILSPYISAFKDNSMWKFQVKNQEKCTVIFAHIGERITVKDDPC